MSREVGRIFKYLRGGSTYGLNIYETLKELFLGGKNNTYPELSFPVSAPLTDYAGVQYKI